MRVIKFAALATLWCGIAAAADDVPAWLKGAAAATLPAYDKKVNVVVLLDEEQTAIVDSGKLTTTTRRALKFLSRVGTDAMFVEQYDSASGKVKDFRAWMIPASGKVKKYGKDEVVDVACAETDVYNECRRRVVSGNRDLDVGAVFAYEAVIERQSFIPQLSFHFQERSPVRLARFTVTAPADWEIKALSFNGAPAERPPAAGAYTWQMENLPAIEPETSAPGASALAPWVGVNLIGKQRSTPTWREAARTLAALNEGVAEPNDAIAAKASELTRGAATELDKIRAIGRFVQQIKYVSVQVNVAKGGGYRPHPAPQVFQKLYGDCKDKANLMRAMLKSAGVTAYPVAIYSGDRTHVRKDWPSLGVFNHAISAIRVDAETKSPAVLEHPTLGRLLFFDPTDPYTPPGRLPGDEQGSFALLGEAEAGDLVQVPSAPPIPEERQRTVQVTLGADGSVVGSFVDRRSGESLAQALAELRGEGKAEFVKSIERWVGRSVPGALSSEIDAVEVDGAMTMKGRFESTRYAQSPQRGMLLLRAAPLRHLDTPALIEKSRKQPVVVDSDALVETSRFALPAGYKVDELPGAVKLDSPFGRFEAAWTVDAGALVFRRRIEIPARIVPAEQYAALKKFLDNVAGAPEKMLVLMKEGQ